MTTVDNIEERAKIAREAFLAAAKAFDDLCKEAGTPSEDIAWVSASIASDLAIQAAKRVDNVYYENLRGKWKNV